jgi:hypothetical protein
MEYESQLEPVQGTQFFPQKPLFRLLLVGLLFITAFFARLYHIDKLDFSPLREYRSAIIARGHYFETLESIPEWRREVARASKQAMSILEPPIMESLAAIGYRIAGGEHLWIPRSLSLMFWLIGGVFLYLIALKITSKDGALFSTAFYLLLPYGAYASRGFTPDPLMVMTLLISLLAILRYYEESTKARLLIAAALSSLSIFIKPVGLFPILGAFISLAVLKQGTCRGGSALGGCLPSAIDVRLLIFTLVGLLPAAVFYTYGMFHYELLHHYSQTSSIPHLLLKPIFWAGWLYQIHVVIGFPAFIGGLLGVLFFHQGLARAFLIGLWGGYIASGLALNYRIHTHENYQLPFIPILALSLGPVFVLFMNQIERGLKRQAVGLGVFLLGVFLGIVGITIALYRPCSVDLKDLEEEVRIAKEIGQHVGHSTRTVFLSYAYGGPLLYHGELSGKGWVHSTDLRVYEMVGRKGEDVEDRFNDISLRYSPEYFIITDLKEFKRQGDLRTFLTRNFPLMVQNDEYLIFDLRKRLEKQR